MEPWDCPEKLILWTGQGSANEYSADKFLG